MRFTPPPPNPLPKIPESELSPMLAQTPISAYPVITSSHDHAVRVLDVCHWTDSLFSFTVSRPPSFRFRSGEFVMLGLLDASSRPLLRAYSIATPFWDERLGFYSIKVADGPLTSRLSHIRAGDYILLRPKPVGTLVLDALLPARRLYLVATGTGIAPFAALIRDPEIYDRFDSVILTHTCREGADLAFSQDLVARTKSDPLIGEAAQQKLTYYPTITRPTTPPPSTLHTGRITHLIESGVLYNDLGVPPLSPVTDRVMICGSMAMNRDMKRLCMDAGLREGSNSAPGDFVLEKAFVD